MTLTFSEKEIIQYMAHADFMRKFSDDPDTQVGCVIVDKNHNIKSTGTNTFPRGVNKNISTRLERPTKYSFIEHAERNAVYSAAKRGISLDDCVAFVTLAPCPDCTRALIQAGISELIFVPMAPEYLESRKTSNDITYDMLNESGIKYMEFQKDNFTFDHTMELFNIPAADELSKSLIKKNGKSVQLSVAKEEICEHVIENSYARDKQNADNLLDEAADMLIVRYHIINAYDFNLDDLAAARNNILSKINTVKIDLSRRNVAMLNLQKSLMKNTNRGKHNTEEIFENLARADAELFIQILHKHSASEMLKKVNDKITRTINREKLKTK